jgi:predicted amidohydrolase
VKNQLPHIACTRVGKDKYSNYPGGSFIVDGWGARSGEGRDRRVGSSWRIRSGRSKEIRQTGSILEDRRPEFVLTVKIEESKSISVKTVKGNPFWGFP